jgi:hypothetical protein
MVSSREKLLVWKGVFYGFGLWEIKFLNIPYLFAGFALLWRCLPATYCTTYYGIKRMKEEQGSLLQQKKKLWMQQGLNPWLHDERPAPTPLNHEDLCILKASLFHLAEPATSEFWLSLHHPRHPKQTFAKWVCLIYEPGATKLLFFLQQWPQKDAFLSLDVKCDQQTHKKDASNYGVNLKKII